MPKRITVRELSDVLTSLGFVGPRVYSTHMLFKHDPTGTLIVLPRLKKSELVGPARLAAVRLSIIGREVATADQFDEALGAVHT
jgi:hypothetical protein